MTAVNLFAAGLALVTYGTFMRRSGRIFSRPDPPRMGLILIAFGAIFSAVAEILAVLHAQLGGLRLWTGGFLYLSSLGLFLQCSRVHRQRPVSLAYSRDAPVHLVTHGPYRWVRHPFYTAYLTSYVAGLVMAGEPRLGVVVVGMGVLYLRAAMVEERKFAASPLKAAYQFYRARTGMFLPNPWKWWRSVVALA